MHLYAAKEHPQKEPRLKKGARLNPPSSWDTSAGPSEAASWRGPGAGPGPPCPTSWPTSRRARRQHVGMSRGAYPAKPLPGHPEHQQNRAKAKATQHGTLSPAPCFSRCSEWPGNGFVGYAPRDMPPPLRFSGFGSGSDDLGCGSGCDDRDSGSGCRDSQSALRRGRQHTNLQQDSSF